MEVGDNLEGILEHGALAYTGMLVETPERLAKLREIFKVDLQDPVTVKNTGRVMPEVFNAITAADPTAKVDAAGHVVKCGIYSQWMLQQYTKASVAEQSRFDEDLYKVVELLKVYDRLKGRLPADKRNIMNLKTVNELRDAVAIVQPLTDAGEDVTGSGEVEKLFDNDEWIILIPKTKKAAIFYGKGTEWCTATESAGYNRFYQYSEMGPLFIAIPKLHADERYQFHVESKQYMDCSDSPVEKTFFSDHPVIGSTIVEYREKHGLTTPMSEVYALAPGKVFELYAKSTPEGKAAMLKKAGVPTVLAVDGWLNGTWTGDELTACQVGGSPHLIFSEDRQTVSVAAPDLADMSDFFSHTSGRGRFDARKEFLNMLSGDYQNDGYLAEVRDAWDSINDQNMKVIERCCLDAGEEYFEDGEVDKDKLPDDVEHAIAEAGAWAQESAAETARFNSFKNALDDAVGGTPGRIEHRAYTWSFPAARFRKLVTTVEGHASDEDAHVSLADFIDNWAVMLESGGDLATSPDGSDYGYFDDKEFNENLAEKLDGIDPGEELDKYVEGYRKAAEDAAVVAARLYEEHEEWGGMDDLLQRISTSAGVPLERLARNVNERVTDQQSFTNYMKKYLWPDQFAQALKDTYDAVPDPEEVGAGSAVAESIRRILQ